ncbi:MAG: OmpA family protein [Archangiaceae bacterium]|nr:OmpA family protein [Archangiaceae bacterium]
MRTTTLSLLALLGTGCVTQGTYDLLKAERDHLEEELAARNQTLEQRERKITAQEDALKKLEANLLDLTQQKADLDARLNRSLAELANRTKDASKLKADVDQMTLALADLEKRRAQAEARVNEFKNLLARFKALIDAGKLKVRIVEGRMVVVLATDILFAPGSASLSKDGKTAISEVAQVLASIPNRNFQVEGHTDAQPISTAQFPSNWELAAFRGTNVVKAMIEAGMPKERISAASFADTKPVGVNDMPEGRALNRRIEITIVPDLSTLPGFEELQKVEKSG